VKFWKAVDGAQARLAADQAEDLRTAIKRSVDVDKVVEDWLRSHANTPSIKPSEARHWARLNIRVDNTVTRAVWRKMLATGYVLGDDVAPVAIARSQLNKADAPDLSNVQTAINYDWSNWKAGNRAASALLQPPKGLAQLLAQTNASIAGMDATTLDRLGTVLADSLNTGASVTATAQSVVRDGLASSLKVGLENVLQDAQRAMTISRTEISRALNVSCRENYVELGVEQYEWLALEPCDDCEENDGVVVTMGDAFPSGDTEPPVHPNCRCTILPVIDEGVPAIEDVVVEDDFVEDVVPEMQDASNIVAVETHPDLVAETTELEPVVADKTLPERLTDKDAKDELMNYQLNAGFSKDQFTPEQFDAVRDYKDEGFANINYALRASAEDLAENFTEQELTSYFTQAQNLKDVIEAAPRLPEDIMASRVVAGEFANTIRSLEIGDSFTDLGFASSTLSQRVITEWTSVYSNTATLDIVYPKDSKGLFVGHFLRGGDAEQEWLPQAGTKFTVLSKEGNVITVRAEN